MMTDLREVFDEQVRSEFEVPDADTTMKTMVKQVYVHPVPVLTRRVGDDGVYNFYKSTLLAKCQKIPNLNVFHGQ